MKLVKHIANLGYGSRKQVQLMFREGRITDTDGEVLYADDAVAHEAIRVDGEPLDPPPGLTLMLHKPRGYTCSTKDTGRLIYDLLPPRFRERSPQLSSVGRLVVCALMFVGRLGPFTLALAVGLSKARASYSYPSTKIVVG